MGFKLDEELCYKYNINSDALTYVLDIQNKDEISILDKLIFDYFIDDKTNCNSEKELKTFKKAIFKDILIQLKSTFILLFFSVLTIIFVITTFGPQVQTEPIVWIVFFPLIIVSTLSIIIWFSLLFEEIGKYSQRIKNIINLNKRKLDKLKYLYSNVKNEDKEQLLYLIKNMHFDSTCEYKEIKDYDYEDMCIKYINFFRDVASKNMKHLLTGNVYYDSFVIDLSKLLYKYSRNDEENNIIKMKNFLDEIDTLKHNINFETKKFMDIYMLFHNLSNEIKNVLDENIA